MIPKYGVNRMYCLLLLSVLFIFPDQAHALQSHGQPEGIYVHQLAHIFFLSALCYLFWDVRRSSFTGKGWRFLQLFCVFMVLWNLVAFTGHWVAGSIHTSEIFSGSGYLGTKITAPINYTKIIYFFTKLDHFLSVPALVCLYLCMRSLYRESCKGGDDT